MIVAATSSANTPTGSNWYDIVVLATLVYGVVTGVRTGFTREVIRTIGFAAMVLLGLKYYGAVGAWLKPVLYIPTEIANLMAFILIAALIYGVMYGVRELVHRRIMKFSCGAFVENVGGGTLGFFRMLAIMGTLTVLLCLLRSDFWHDQIARNSQFGAYVVNQSAPLAELAKKRFPEKLWFTQEIKRRGEPLADESEPKKKR